MNILLSKPIKTFFGHYLPVQRGLCANTINAYRDAIRLLLCFVADQINQSVDTLYIEQLNERQISAWLNHLEHTRSCSIQTRNARLAAIRSFFAFIARQYPQLLEQCQQVRAIPIKKVRAHYSPDYLEENEMQALMDAVDLKTRTGTRDQALLLLFYNTGARVSEVVALKLENLNRKGKAQVRLTGKGQKVRTCPLWPQTVSAINDYLKERETTSDTDNLFLNAKGLPISRFGIRYVINKYASIAQQQCVSMKGKNITPHTLRHTTAMHLLRSGNDITMVSYWLGHASINTTHAYLEIDMEMKRKMIENTDAPDIRKKPKWHEPELLEWLNELGKKPTLCEVGVAQYA